MVSSATFLEATINELFQDAKDDHGTRDDGYIAPLSPEARAAMSMVWRATKHGRNLGTFEKWQWLVECCGMERLDSGKNPAQDALLVIRLRNLLVHYRPENVAVDEEHELEKALRTKFAPNALLEGSGNPWWPDFCLGHGCTEWAVASARELADHVLAEVGVTPNYQRLQESDWMGKPP